MTTLNSLIAVLLTVSFSFSAPSVLGQPDDHMMVKPGDLKWEDLPGLPGAKVAVLEGPIDKTNPVTFRVKLPANYEVPPHWHPSDEHVTVISGAINLGMGDKLDRKKTTALTAGGFAIMPAKAHHFAWTKSETILQVHGMGPWAINYVNPAEGKKK
jgi:quercetin dioxygenase-like cupin family protein